MSSKWMVVKTDTQQLNCFEADQMIQSFCVSTAANGLGEQTDSYCTPRGWHRVHSILGLDCPLNSVFVAREWTGEIYTPELDKQAPDRDWILTRIIRLDGLEPGRNRGGSVDSFNRYIYIHGTPDKNPLGAPNSKGCIRMNNHDIIWLAGWAEMGSKVYIK